MILFNTVKGVTIKERFYAVHVEEIYRDFYNNKFITDGIQKRHGIYLIDDPVYLIKFIELYRKNTVMAELLIFKFGFVKNDDLYNYYETDYSNIEERFETIVKLDEIMNEYNLFCSLWEKDGIYAVEAYKLFSENKEREIERLKRLLNEEVHEEREDWPSELGYSPSYYAIQDELESSEKRGFVYNKEEFRKFLEKHEIKYEPIHKDEENLWF